MKITTGLIRMVQDSNEGGPRVTAGFNTAEITFSTGDLAFVVELGRTDAEIFHERIGAVLEQLAVGAQIPAALAEMRPELDEPTVIEAFGEPARVLGGPVAYRPGKQADRLPDDFVAGVDRVSGL